MSQPQDTPPAPQNELYFVVKKTLIGTSQGVMTWGAYKSREAFEESYAGFMMDGSYMPLNKVYEVVAQGITKDEVTRLILSPENQEAAVMSSVREAREYTAAALRLAAPGNG